MSSLFRSSRRPGDGRFWWVDASSAALALLLAIVAWVVAIYEQDPPIIDSFQGIPIQYINARQDLVVVGAPVAQATLRVRAPKSHWAAQGVSAGVFEATVDLEGLEEGVHNLEVQARSLDKMTLIESCSPARVVVRLEERVRREFPVQAQVADPDSVPLGYAAAQPVASPSRATVTGPRSLVEEVRGVRARVWLRSSKVALESEVDLVAVDEQGQPVSGVEITPETVTVRLAVEALEEFRDVTVRVPTVGAPAAGYWISAITAEPAAVTVQGRPEIIRQMASVVSTLPLDVNGVKESFNRRVTLELPEGVTVYSGDSSTHSVLVRVEVTPIIGGKTVQPRVQWLGLRSGYVVHLSPDTVDVILSGPMPELQALQVEDVQVVVNLFGLGAGRFQVVPTVQLPDGSELKVERFSPDVVEVTITPIARGGS
jgi:YbbR domain-containing protein